MSCALITSAPGKLLVGSGHCKRSFEPGGFYFPHFFLEKAAPWFSYEHVTEIDLADLKGALPPARLQWKEPEQELFETFFHETRQLEKGVPYTFRRSSQKPDVAAVLSHLANYKGNAALYGFWDDEEGMLGATPESLFHLKGDQLETMAVAGTRTTLQLDKTVNREHEIVVKGIVEALSPYASVSVAATEWLTLPHFAHLVTPIRGTLTKALNFEEIVSLLHPTPALGAYPREPGMRWLRSMEERLPRKRYGAPVGFLGKEHSFAYVAIRNIQWDGSGTKMAAGCGVVASSRLADEWNEIQLKLHAIQEMMGL